MKRKPAPMTRDERRTRMAAATTREEIEAIQRESDARNPYLHARCSRSSGPSGNFINAVKVR